MINIRNWSRNIIEDSKRVAIPIMTHPGIEMCNYKVVDAVKDGNVHFKAIKKLCDLYPSSAATVIMDLTVEAEAFGAEVIFPEDEVPSVIGTLVSSLQDVENLVIPNLNAGRIPEYLLANKLAAENITDRPVLAGCIGPFSLAGRLMGMSEIMIGIYTEPEMVLSLLEKCTSFLIDYCRGIKNAGASGVVMAEPAAGLISADECSMYSSVYVKRIVEELQDDNFMIILHNCGNTGHCTSAMVETGAEGLHFGNQIDMVDALEKCPENCLIMGNIDPVNCMKMGTPQYVYDTVLDLLKRTSKYKNFILSTGCDVPPNVSSDNIEAFYRALSDYNK